MYILTFKKFKMCEFERCSIKRPTYNKPGESKAQFCVDYEPENSRKKPEDIKKRYKLLSDFLTDIKDNKMKLPYELVSAF